MTPASDSAVDATATAALRENIWDSIGPALSSAASGFPEEAVRLAHQHRAEVTPYLVRALTDHRQVVLDDAIDQHDLLPMFALMLLTQWREPAGFTPLLDIAALPGELPWKAFGDSVAQDFPYALALMSGGAPESVQALQTRVIENRACDEDVRDVALYALMVLVATGAVARASVLDYCCGLLARAVRERGSPISDYLASIVASALYPLRPIECMAQIRAAYEAGVIDPTRIALSEFEALAGEVPGQGEEGIRHGLTLYDDIAADMRTWPCFQPDADNDDDVDDDEWLSPGQPSLANAASWLPRDAVPYVRATPKTGRNDPCPCGSGKKFKKCCLGDADASPMQVD